MFVEYHSDGSHHFHRLTDRFRSLICFGSTRPSDRQLPNNLDCSVPLKFHWIQDFRQCLPAYILFVAAVSKYPDIYWNLWKAKTFYRWIQNGKKHWWPALSRIPYICSKVFRISTHVSSAHIRSVFWSLLGPRGKNDKTINDFKTRTLLRRLCCGSWLTHDKDATGTCGN